MPSTSSNSRTKHLAAATANLQATGRKILVAGTLADRAVLVTVPQALKATGVVRDTATMSHTSVLRRASPQVTVPPDPNQERIVA